MMRLPDPTPRYFTDEMVRNGQPLFSEDRRVRNGVFDLRDLNLVMESNRRWDLVTPTEFIRPAGSPQ
jgi:hypothetical protein